MKSIYIANWKMNGTRREVENYVEILSNHLFLDTIILALPFVYLECAKKLLSPCLKLGAQNLHESIQGAHTGEISASMVKDVGCDYVILGHSECRFSGEDNVTVAQKMTRAFEHELIPILCIGETLQQKERGETSEVLHTQLNDALMDVASNKSFIIAYEPVWAIGTGQVASLEDVSLCCTFIQGYLKERGFEGIPILYGGSVTANNAHHLKTCAHVSGFLVGGASLNAESFLNIIEG